MAADKHLVLDEDVHRKLKQRKRDTGLTVREIGNSVLRSVLWRQSLSELIGRKLVESGALSAEEYTRIREAALNEAANELYTTEKAIELTEKGTVITGSWEAQERFCLREGLYQIMEAWARDGRAQPMPPTSIPVMSTSSC